MKIMPNMTVIPSLYPMYFDLLTQQLVVVQKVKGICLNPVAPGLQYTYLSSTNLVRLYPNFCNAYSKTPDCALVMIGMPILYLDRL